MGNAVYLPRESEDRVDGVTGKDLDARSDMLNESRRLAPLETGNQPCGLIMASRVAAQPNAVAADYNKMRWRHER